MKYELEVIRGPRTVTTQYLTFREAIAAYDVAVMWLDDAEVSIHDLVGQKTVLSRAGTPG